jgi:hypothetical protein
MDVNYREVRELNINVIHDATNGYDELTPFISSLGKIKKEITRGGFKNMFNGDERAIWLKVFERIEIKDEKNGKGPEIKIL